MSPIDLNNPPPNHHYHLLVNREETTIEHNVRLFKELGVFVIAAVFVGGIY